MDVSSPAAVSSAAPRTAPGRSRLETRRRLVAAATELFARDGLHGVTTHAIAGAAGVAAGTFYLHFPDKQSLFAEIARAAMQELADRLGRVARDASSASQATRSRSTELCRFADENRDLVRILFGRGAEVAELASEILDGFAASLRDHMQEQIEVGVYDPALHADVASQAVVGLLARVIVWWIEDPDRVSRTELIETLTRIQLSGLCGHAAPVHPAS